MNRLGELVLAAHREGASAVAIKKDKRSHFRVLFLERNGRHATIVGTDPDQPVGRDLTEYVETMLDLSVTDPPTSSQDSDATAAPPATPPPGLLTGTADPAHSPPPRRQQTPELT